MQKRGCKRAPGGRKRRGEVEQSEKGKLGTWRRKSTRKEEKLLFQGHTCCPAFSNRRPPRYKNGLPTQGKAENGQASKLLIVFLRGSMCWELAE